ncbi:unnamed protein product [Urochloa humidicola]
MPQEDASWHLSECAYRSPSYHRSLGVANTNCYAVAVLQLMGPSKWSMHGRERDRLQLSSQQQRDVRLLWNTGSTSNGAHILTAQYIGPLACTQNGRQKKGARLIEKGARLREKGARTMAKERGEEARGEKQQKELIAGGKSYFGLQSYMDQSQMMLFTRCCSASACAFFLVRWLVGRPSSMVVRARQHRWSSHGGVALGAETPFPIRSVAWRPAAAAAAIDQNHSGRVR